VQKYQKVYFELIMLRTSNIIDQQQFIRKLYRRLDKTKTNKSEMFKLSH